jgi:hypothetical protein
MRRQMSERMRSFGRAKGNVPRIPIVLFSLMLMLLLTTNEGGRATQLKPGGKCKREAVSSSSTRVLFTCKLRMTQRGALASGVSQLSAKSTLIRPARRAAGRAEEESGQERAAVCLLRRGPFEQRRCDD